MYQISEFNATSFNYWDIIIIVFIGLTILNGYRIGLLKSVFGTVSFIAVIILTYYLLPPTAKFIRLNTGVYESIKNAVTDTLQLKTLAETATKQAEIHFIDSLRLPEFLKTSLLANNNDAVYEILGVNSLSDFISGYIANICVNIIAVVSLLIITSIVLSVIINILDLVSKLPIINTLNKFGGMIFGFFQGILGLWIVFVLFTLLLFIPFFTESYIVLLQSSFASKIYETNLLLKMILNIFT